MCDGHVIYLMGGSPQQESRYNYIVKLKSSIVRYKTKKSVANRLGNEQKFDTRRLASDELAEHNKITNDRNG